MSDDAPTTQAFFEHAAISQWQPELRAEVDALLRAGLAPLGAARPEFMQRQAEFLAFVAERFGQPEDAAAAMRSLRFEELWLCFCAVGGQDAAVTELEKMFSAEAEVGLRRLSLSASAKEEAMQRARVKLFVGQQDKPAKLAQYSGHGSLGGWMRVVVVRTALNAQRAERRHAPRDDDVLASRIADDARDPELEVIRARYASALSEAVAEAFRRLTGEQRNLLRMYVIDRLTLTELSRLHSVDASTVSRWLAKIRGKLLEDAQSHLMQRHAMRPSECESLFRAVQSNFHLTIERLLHTEPEGHAED